MAEQLFGTDGFRGSYDSTAEPGRVNPETFQGLAYSYASIVREQTGEAPTFVIGGDTRSSSPELIKAASEGAAAAGAEVWDIETAPTPVIAWLAQEHGTNAIAITASHNPDHDNGIKLFEAGGVKTERDVLDAVEERYWEAVGNETPSSVEGQIIARPELTGSYLDYVAAKLGGPGVLNERIVVVDGANGAALDLAPHLYERLGARVIRFACDPNAVINQGVGAAHLEGLQEFLARNPELTSDSRFIGGFANDGDADRVMGVDAKGRIIDGNHWMRRLAMGQAGIVGTLYTNTALRRAVESDGVEFHECANGDSYVTAMLQELSVSRGEGYTRGGEFTGHLIDLDHLPTGDGVYMGGFMATDLAKNGKSLTDVYEGLRLWPELMKNVRTNGANAKEVVASEAVQAAVAAHRAEHEGSARIIMRASGTEPLIRVWAEGEDGEIVKKIVNDLSETVGSLTK